MSSSASIQDILDRWRAGDQAAAAELYRRYDQRLWDLAAGQIGQRLGRRVGPDDIVQSVFRTFFRRTSQGEYAFDHSGALWQLLVRITHNKIYKQAERHHAKRRNVNAEVPLDGDRLSPEAVTHEPTPDEVATLVDEMECLLSGLEAPEPEMVRLAIEGRTASEIAKQVGCSRWTVRRVLDRVGAGLRKRLEENNSD